MSKKKKKSISNGVNHSLLENSDKDKPAVSPSNEETSKEEKKNDSDTTKEATGKAVKDEPAIETKSNSYALIVKEKERNSVKGKQIQKNRERAIQREKDKDYKKFYEIKIIHYPLNTIKIYRSKLNLLKFSLFMMIASICLVGFLTIFMFSEISTMEKEVKSLNQKAQVQNDTIMQLSAENTELKAQNDILSTSVGIQAVEEDKLHKQSVENHTPTGFPLTGSSTMEKLDSKAEDYVMHSLFVLKDQADVVSAADGVVLSVESDKEFGNCIKIDHENGYVSVYRCKGACKVIEGESVVRGTILIVPKTSNCRLYYQIYYKDKLISPESIMKING